MPLLLLSKSNPLYWASLWYTYIGALIPHNYTRAKNRAEEAQCFPGFFIYMACLVL